MGKLYKKISIIGCGTWGIAISKHLSSRSSIYLNHYRKDYLESLDKSRIYRGSFDFKLPSNIQIDYNLSNRSDLYVISTPVQYIRSAIKVSQIPEKSKILVLSKGIESETLMFPSQIIQDIFKEKKVDIGVLTGPSHAEQIIEGSPASLVVSSLDSEFSKDIQQLFSDDTFRVYYSRDMVGVQLGGAVKNVISIASGIAWGLGFKENTVAAILTRGLYEIKKLGEAIGVNKDTLNGLAGLGDLMATSFSLDSRNRYVGHQLAKGNNVEDIAKNMNMNAEGVETSRSLYLLSRKLEVDMPICKKVYDIIYRNEDPTKAIANLMNRELRSEF